MKPNGQMNFSGLLISKNSAKYLLIRNAGQKELFRKKSFLLDKAKFKEERSLDRKRESLIQSHTRGIQNLHSHSVPNKNYFVRKPSLNGGAGKIGSNNGPLMNFTARQRKELSTTTDRKHGTTSLLSQRQYSVGTMAPISQGRVTEQRILPRMENMRKSSRSLSDFPPPNLVPTLPPLKIPGEKKSEEEP